MNKKIILPFLGFCTVGMLVKLHFMDSFDLAVYDAVISLRNSYLDVFFKIVTHLGSTYFLLPLVILIKDKKKGWTYILALLLTLLLTKGMKLLMMRPRPAYGNLIVESDTSFPSGHSFNSVVGYGFLGIGFNKVGLGIILVLLVGFSRIYLGVHYFSDVVGGYLIGLSFLNLCIEEEEKIIRLFNKIKK